MVVGNYSNTAEPVPASSHVADGLTTEQDAKDNRLICRYPGCKSSGRVFKRSYELKRHNLIHFPDKRLRCPIHGCKQTTKKKTWTRDDKFREHVEAHGPSALFRCPIQDCRSEPLAKSDFSLHVARQHALVDRLHVESFLVALRIEGWRGERICPLPCGENCTGKIWLVQEHLPGHDLGERSRFIASIDLAGLSNSYGVASCPICRSQVCRRGSLISDLCYHIERSHSADDQAAHGIELAKLLGHFAISNHWVSHEHWQLFNIVRRFIPQTRNVRNPASSKPEFSLSLAGTSPGGSGDHHLVLDDGFLKTNTHLSAAFIGVSPSDERADASSEIEAQWSPSQLITADPHSSILSEPFVTPHNFLSVQTYQASQPSLSLPLPLHYEDTSYLLKSQQNEWNLDNIPYDLVDQARQPLQTSMIANTDHVLLPGLCSSSALLPHAVSSSLWNESSRDNSYLSLDSQSQFQQQSFSTALNYQDIQQDLCSSLVVPHQTTFSCQEIESNGQNGFYSSDSHLQLQQQSFMNAAVHQGQHRLQGSSLSDLPPETLFWQNIKYNGAAQEDAE